jgi:hypothetical protein
MAPLPVTENASAVALVTFVRAFSQAWGVAISGAILQNGLRARLPQEVLSRYAAGAELAYAVIPDIPGLSPELRTETQAAFADSLHLVWVVMLALCGAGMASVGLMKHFSLRKTTDKQWGLKEKEKAGGEGKDEESGSGGRTVRSSTEVENSEPEKENVMDGGVGVVVEVEEKST